MTQTSTKPTPDAPGLFPPGRYGRRRDARRRPRWVLPALVLAGVAIMSLIAVKLYFEYGAGELTPTVISTTNITNNSITVTFDVAKSDSAPVTCTVQGFTHNGTQVGEAQVAVPAGRNVKVTYALATTARPYMAEVPACQPVK